MAPHQLNSFADFNASNLSTRTPTSIDSPPSLIYTDFSEDSEETIMQNMTALACEGQGGRADASMVVQQVLGKLDHVVEHLRIQDENDAANAIARSTIEIVNTFNNVTAPWDLQMFQMNPLSDRRPPPGLANAGTAAQPRPAVATAGSWASVAATAVKKTNNPLIKYHPSDAVIKRHKEPEPNIEDMRVVWIQGWRRGRPLGQISEYITQGPICSMAYAPDHTAVCIVFQYSESARALVATCEMFEEEEGHCLFGSECTVVAGQAFPMNEDLQRMAPPINERRRLTFARSQLFAHGMSETVFKDDIYHLVGEGNVELVWLFNSGNATVVFTSTGIARIVRESFLRRARLDGPYSNVHVTYSHDPCEKPMNLITQIGATPTSRPRSDSSENSSNGVYRSNTRNGGLSRRESKRRSGKSSSADNDGWQTVTHKK